MGEFKDVISAMRQSKWCLSTGKERECLKYVDKVVGMCTMGEVEGVSELWWNFIWDLVNCNIERTTIIYKVLAYTDIDMILKDENCKLKLEKVVKQLNVSGTKLVKETSVYFYINKFDWHRRALFSLQILNSRFTSCFLYLSDREVNKAVESLYDTLGMSAITKDEGRLFCMCLTRMSISTDIVVQLLRIICKYASKDIQEDMAVYLVRFDQDIRTFKQAVEVLS